MRAGAAQGQSWRGGYARGGARKRTRAGRICRRAYGRGARVSNSASIRRDGCDAEGGSLMNILVPDISLAEKVLRSGAVYVFLLVAFRLCP